MQGMMQSLLSAEILLPSLKDLVEKYPQWLEENATKISVEDKDRYEKQLQIMRTVCGELEGEKESDSADVKKDRFNKVLEEMQKVNKRPLHECFLSTNKKNWFFHLKIHELGQPPKDLIGDVDGAGLPNFDPTAMGAMGADPSQCSLM
jgi:peroxin-19